MSAATRHSDKLGNAARNGDEAGLPVLLEYINDKPAAQFWKEVDLRTHVC